MTLVIDASVAVKWFVAEPGSDDARVALAGGERLVAPETILGEVCNTAWRLLRLGAIDRDMYRGIASGLPAVLGDIVSVRPLLMRASEIAAALDHPVYDCFYVALAEREDCAVVTADRKLVNRATEGGWSARVKLLGSAR